jgi:virulence-associated protein VapD
MAVPMAPAPLPQVRQGLPGEFRRAGRVYAIAFDMDIEALRANYGEPYNNAYLEIRRVLQRHGFTWQQGSVYFGGETVTAVTWRVTIGAEKGEQRIAVEVQSFLNRSVVRDLEEAVGQYEIYRTVLARSEPDRLLYLAVPRYTFETVLAEQFGQLILSELHLRLLVFNDQQERVIQWIN